MDKRNHSIHSVLRRPIRDEKWQSITIPLVAIIISLIAAAIVILIIGRNPLQAFLNLLQGEGIVPKPVYAGYKSVLTDFLHLLNAMTPLVFASLAVIIALKAGLFNIGVSGQMLFSGFLATILIGYSDFHPLIAKPLVLVVGIIAGGLMADLSAG